MPGLGAVSELSFLVLTQYDRPAARGVFGRGPGGAAPPAAPGPARVTCLRASNHRSSMTPVSDPQLSDRHAENTAENVNVIKNHDRGACTVYTNTSDPVVVF